MNKKKVFYNLLASIITQVISIVVSLLIPRLLIGEYGSEVNGLVSSVNQLVRYFAIFETGVCAAACASLYKPLVEKKYDKVNSILSAVNSFYIKSGIILLIVSILFSTIYPIKYISSDTTLYIQSIIVIFITCFASVLSYLAYLKYNLVLFVNAQQYVTILSASFVNLLAAAVQFVFIKMHLNIIIIVSVLPVLTIIRLIILKYYTLKKYNYIKFDCDPDYDSISQKWSGMTLNVSQILKTLIPIVFLNFMFDFKVVSVFTIYSTVFHVGSSIISTAGNGLTPMFGNMVAKNEFDKIKEKYKLFTMIIFNLSIILCVCFYCLMSSFIDLYIGVSEDISYQVPIFTIFLIINELLVNLKFAPDMLIKATGHLNDTNRSVIIEMILAIVLTPISCAIFGYKGVMVGTVLASFYRLIYISYYCRSKILNVNFKDIIQNIVVYGLSIVISIFVASFILIKSNGIIVWIINGGICVSTSIIILLIMNLILNKQNTMTILRRKYDR